MGDMHTHMHTCVHKCTHACARTHTHAHARTHARSLARSHPCTHARTHACSLTCSHASAHAARNLRHVRPLAYTLACTHARTHGCLHTHAHDLYTHPYACSDKPQPSHTCAALRTPSPLHACLCTSMRACTQAFCVCIEDWPFSQPHMSETCQVPKQWRLHSTNVALDLVELYRSFLGSMYILHPTSYVMPTVQPSYLIDLWRCLCCGAMQHGLRLAYLMDLW